MPSLSASVSSANTRSSPGARWCMTWFDSTTSNLAPPARRPAASVQSKGHTRSSPLFSHRDRARIRVGTDPLHVEAVPSGKAGEPDEQVAASRSEVEDARRAAERGEVRAQPRAVDAAPAAPQPVDRVEAAKRRLESLWVAVGVVHELGDLGVADGQVHAGSTEVRVRRADSTVRPGPKASAATTAPSAEAVLVKEVPQDEEDRRARHVALAAQHRAGCLEGGRLEAEPDSTRSSTLRPPGWTAHTSGVSSPRNAPTAWRISRPMMRGTSAVSTMSKPSSPMVHTMSDSPSLVRTVPKRSSSSRGPDACGVARRRWPRRRRRRRRMPRRSAADPPTSGCEACRARPPRRERRRRAARRRSALPREGPGARPRSP